MEATSGLTLPVMRKLWPALFLAFATQVQAATGITLDVSKQYTFADCASAGSSAQTIPGGTYLVTSTDEDVWECLADSGSTCASGGVRLPLGLGFVQSIGNGGKSISCRSAASTGDLQMTRVY